MDVDTSDSNDSHGSGDSDAVVGGAPCQAVPDIDQDQDWMTNCTEETVSFFSALEQSGVSSDAVEKLQMYAESQCLAMSSSSSLTTDLVYSTSYVPPFLQILNFLFWLTGLAVFVLVAWILWDYD